MMDQSSLPPEKPMPPMTEEPDDEGFTPSTSAPATAAPASNDTPLPKRKPLEEPGLLEKTGNLLRNSGNLVKASALKVDHPYGGDGKYSAPGLETLRKLGAGSPYGGSN